MRTDEEAGRLNAAYEAGYAAGFAGVEARSFRLEADSAVHDAYAAGYDSGREGRAEYDEHEHYGARA